MNRPFWASDAAEVTRDLGSSERGLSADEASSRAAELATQRLRAHRHVGDLRLLARQFTSPILLLLVAASAVAGIAGDPVDSFIILGIVAASGLLGFVQERSASRAVERLLASIRVRARVVRGGVELEVPIGDVVPGDIVVLEPGDVIPADVRLTSVKALFVDEATLTGESFPVEKSAEPANADAPLAKRSCVGYLGTHVVSGGGRGVAVHIGRKTQLGAISQRLDAPVVVTDFERGIRRLGAVLLEITSLLVLSIFACNVYLARPVLDSLLFAVALAVGLTPQLLPAIISVNLARGARRMAEARVIVKQLTSIENFGSMTVLCTDKTGTLTEGVVTVGEAIACDGSACDDALRLARLNAALAARFPNPIDDAIRASGDGGAAAWTKKDELPYDFARKCVSVLLTNGHERLLVTKGAADRVVASCTDASLPGGARVDIETVRGAIDAALARMAGEGKRVLAIATRAMQKDELARDDERTMTFVGLLALADAPKAGIADTVARLRDAGVRICMLTGDSCLVARHVARALGDAEPRVVGGAELMTTSDEALARIARDTTVFAELAPHDKERIVRALRRAGDVVGFLGDGINDASAIHAADVGISVDTAADIAKDAAAIVLMDKDLGVLLRGVEEGRRTFVNTLKYVFMATSANFGNMFSMAGASLVLPFLPLLPKQVLLTNLLTDIPEMTIADDRVDADAVARPQRWDVRAVTRFMIVFGVVSSVFDYLTFAVLLLAMHASPTEFRTGWFVESVVSATTIVLVIRTRRPSWKSRPGRGLAVACATVVVATIALPFTPIAPLLGFTTVPARFYAALGAIVVLYVASVELAKRVYYRRA